MRERTKIVTKSRTITGKLKIISEESTVGRMFRTRRMLKQIGAQYDLTISYGSMTGMLSGVAGSELYGTHTITGLEQAETVPQKWARALDTVSAEYGLVCVWEEEAVTEGGERSKYGPSPLAGLAKNFAQVGMSGMMGNQVRYLAEQAREREKLTAMLLKLGVDAGDVSNERLAEIHREAMSGKTPYWDSTPKAAEALHSFRAEYSGLTDRVPMAVKAKALAAVSPTGRGTPSFAFATEAPEKVNAKLQSTTLSPKQLMDRIEELDGVVGVKEIRTSAAGSVVVSLFVDVGLFHFDVVKAEIKSMLPLGVTVMLKAEVARMVDADMESSGTTPWAAGASAVLTKAPPKSYADTPTGTVAWDEADGAVLRRRIEGNPCEWSSGENHSLFSRRLHITDERYSDGLTDLLCPCCGNKTGSWDWGWPRFHAKNVGELLSGGVGSDDAEIGDMKAGITCECGVKSTYDFDTETIKLELVKS